MKKLLIIEDDDTTLSLLAEILRLEGYDTITAPDGLAGWEQTITHRPHFIICDLVMPRLDGYHFLEMLRGNRETASTPVMLLSCRATPREVERAMALGATVYFSKPVEIPKLLAAITKHLAAQ